MTSWRASALALGALLLVCGAILWSVGGGPVLLIFGVLALITTALEPVYGRASAKPPGTNLAATNEKFVDPETARLVTVWFDPKTGERHYVDDQAH